MIGHLEFIHFPLETNINNGHYLNRRTDDENSEALLSIYDVPILWALLLCVGLKKFTEMMKTGE